MHAHTKNTSVSGAATIDLARMCLSMELLSQNELKELGLENLSIASPDVRIPESNLLYLWKLLDDASEENGIGLELGRVINPESKGLLASWVSQADNLEQALQIFIDHIALMNPSESWSFLSEGRLAHLHLRFKESQGYPDIAVERSISSLVSWARALSNHPFPVIETRFTFPQPNNVELFTEIFGQNIVFGAAQNGISFERALLSLPVSSGNRFIANLLKRQATQKLSLLKREASFKIRTRALILEALASGSAATVDQVSQKLALSRQTLYRKLHDEGTDFQALLDSARKERAAELIESGESPHVISLMLGYKDASGFYKAFKRWFKTTPTAYATKRNRFLDA